MWLEYGRIVPVALPGLPHEYFPVCGEILYGFLMLPGRDTLFAVQLQNLFCIIMILATLALSEMWRLRRSAALGGALLLQLCPMVCYWAQIGYTDVLNGAVLATGIALLLLAMHRHSMPYALIAGVMLGMSCAIKYSGLLLTPAVTVLLLGCFTMLHRQWRIAGTLVTAAAGSAFLFYLPNWIRTGNPFYPVRIPFLFPNGIDFPREAVGFHRLGEFFLGRTLGTLNYGQVVLILGALVLALAVLFFPASRRRKLLAREMAVLAAALLAAGAGLLAVYPAMTQARCILPVMMTAELLFPALLDRLDVLRRGPRPLRITLTVLAGVLALVLLAAMLNKTAILHLLPRLLLLLFIVLPLSLLRGRWFRRGAWVLIGAGAMFLFTVGSMINVNSDLLWPPEGGGAIYEVVKLEYLTQGKPLRIANAGSWLNYMLMFSMPGNVVESVPVNAENTNHVHELNDVADLRGRPVPYEVWLGRLRGGGYSFLLVDATVRTDFGGNAALERDWAEAHPEDFVKLRESNGMSFYRIAGTGQR